MKELRASSRKAWSIYILALLTSWVAKDEFRGRRRALVSRWRVEVPFHVRSSSGDAREKRVKLTLLTKNEPVILFPVSRHSGPTHRYGTVAIAEME